MNNTLKQKNTFAFTLFTLIAIFVLVVSNIVVFQPKKLLSMYDKLHKVYAEDEEEDHEEDREDHKEEDEHDDDDRKSNQQQEVTYETITIPADAKTILTPVEEKPIIRYITIVDPGFNVDSDGDKLVDALDPDPLIPQYQFFTDDDKDSVPNALDKHPKEDDFLYVQLDDKDNNGISDELEQ